MNENVVTPEENVGRAKRTDVIPYDLMNFYSVNEPEQVRVASTPELVQHRVFGIAAGKDIVVTHRGTYVEGSKKQDLVLGQTVTGREVIAPANALGKIPKPAERFAYSTERVGINNRDLANA